METTTHYRRVLMTERSPQPLGGWNRYRAVLAWLAYQDTLNCREWARIPRAHKALNQAWERTMRAQGYR